MLANFNPRSHGGSDMEISFLEYIIENFNPRSHGGSDGAVVSKPAANDDFNPRSHGGSDVSARIHHRISQKFQSTLPRGERPSMEQPVRTERTDFNPRSHGGSDGKDGEDGIGIPGISIHAPTGGATVYNQSVRWRG